MKKNKIPFLFFIILLFAFTTVSIFSSDLGDVDDSGIVDIEDALLIAQYTVGLNPAGFDPSSADVNRDSDISIVDAFLISQYVAGIISRFPGEVFSIEAEDASYDDAVVETDHAGYSGRGYINTANTDGTYLQWSLIASEAGNAQLEFYYANGSSSSRPMELSINGNVSSLILDFPSHESWAVWERYSATVSLAEGNNTIRITSLTADGAPNLDRLELEFSGLITIPEFTPTPTPTPASTPTGGGDITVWLAGDSTMANGGNSCPVGYGAKLGAFFDNRVTVLNKARGGRSINNWMYNVLSSADGSGVCDIQQDAKGNPAVTGDWQAVLDGMKPGDYLIISFGINDGTYLCPRHTDEGTFKTDLAVMAAAARARGANPIFMTPVSAISCMGSTARGTRGGYVDYTIAVGQQQNVPVIDLHQLSVNLYNTLGFCPLPNGASDVSESTGGEVGAFFCNDHTHFDHIGATAIARVIARAIEDQNLDLKAYLK